MAYGLKYYFEFSDIMNADWRVEILQKDFSETETEVKAMFPPVTIEYYGEDNIFEQSVMGSKVTMSLNSPTDDYFSELFTSENLKYKVDVYYTLDKYWTGFIQADTYSEPYEAAPYTVQLTATDGLGLLKDFSFDDFEYTGRQTIAKIISDILLLINVSTYYESINIYESTMNDADSLLTQAGIDPELFAGKDCYYVLQNILKTFNAGIRQVLGIYFIFRYREITLSFNIRIIENGIVTDTFTYNPIQLINRPEETSYLSDFDGGTKMFLPAYKKGTITQDYGLKESIFKNYEFDYDTWSGSPAAFENWTLGGGATVYPLFYKQAGEDTKGIAFDDGDTTLTHYVYQAVQNIKNHSGAEKFIMEFECMGFTASSVDLYAYISVNGTYYFTGTTWTTDMAPCLIKNFTAGSNFETVKFTVASFPADGALTLEIYDGVSPGGDGFAYYKSIKFYWITAVNEIIKNTSYTITGASQGKELKLDYLIGDGYGFANDDILFKGALNAYDGTTPIPTSKIWHSLDKTENLPLVQLMATEYVNQFPNPKQIIDLPLREMEPNTLLFINGNLQDYYNNRGIEKRVFAISRGTYNIADREWNLTLCELIPSDTPATEIGYTNMSDFGYLYNWYAATDERNIAPAGWHVPTAADYLNLCLYIEPDSNDIGVINTAGGKLKSTSASYWSNPNTGATNEYNFDGRGAGLRYEDGSYGNLSANLNLWNTDLFNNEVGLTSDLTYDSSRFETSNSYDLFYSAPNNGQSIRLLKDDDTDPGYMVGNNGKIYKTVKIGSQVWIASNLEETKYQNGDLINYVESYYDWSTAAVGCWCIYGIGINDL